MRKLNHQQGEIVIKHKETADQNKKRNEKLKAAKEQYKNKIKAIYNNDIEDLKQSYDAIIKDYLDTIERLNKYRKISQIEKIQTVINTKVIKTKQFFIIKWKTLQNKHPNLAQFIAFFTFSNGVTLLQMLLMPLFKSLFEQTNLVYTNFQVGQIGQELSGDPYFMFNYPAGFISEGGGGGLAYFLSVQLTLLIAQVINFFLQRNITFKSKTSIYKAAMWYFIAYVAITLIASASLVLYKVPIYTFFIETLGLGNTGESLADATTMIIYSAISFWVFFPIFKLIFKNPQEMEGK
ncbi:MAG: hypothetical protein UMR38_03130 [Candidatus Izemoplasma sp.]|nr:hypothetical protein [Candidatus Izemoplasma sp.]